MASSVFEQPVDGGDCGVGLARAGGHLDERARAAVLEGLFELLDGADLARPESRGVQHGKPLKARTKRGRLGEPVPYRLRPGKAEHLPGTGPGIAPVCEARNHAGALVNKRQGFAVVHPFEFGGGINGGLLLDRRDLLAPFPRLGLDNAAGFLVDEENVVGGADIRLILANGDPEAGAEIDLLLVLNEPARLREHLVDVVARRLFGCPVGVRHRITRPSPLARNSPQARPRAIPHARQHRSA